VLQGDEHLPHLTVAETVRFAVQLRMDQSSVPALHEARVALIMAMLRLESIADVAVGDRHGADGGGGGGGLVDGDGFVKGRSSKGQGGGGITDGERKRLSIAVEVAALPTLIFADEPTTGLDAPTAYDVMRSVVQLAQQDRSFGGGSGTGGVGKREGADFYAHRTVVATIHQPSPAVFALFSKVLLLAGGRPIFFGAPAEVVDHFTSPLMGYEFEAGANPGDFCVSIAGGGLVAEGQSQPSSPSALYGAWALTPEAQALDAQADGTAGGPVGSQNNGVVDSNLLSFARLQQQQQQQQGGGGDPFSAEAVRLRARTATMASAATLTPKYDNGLGAGGVEGKEARYVALEAMLESPHVSEFLPEARQFRLLLARAWASASRRGDVLRVRRRFMGCVAWQGPFLFVL
jgi:hypothetical protein